MIKTTRWFPDTCECVIDLTWDDQAADRTHAISVVTSCAAHAVLPLPAPGTTLETGTFHPHEQNQRKNKFIGAALEALTDLRDGVTGNFQLKPNINVNMTWQGTGSSRTLLISFDGVTLTAQKKSTLQTKADQLFGAGKITVQ